MEIDLGVAYRSAREEVIRLVTSTHEALKVPATPLWTVHDVCSHLAGVVEDGQTGNFAGAPGEPWTAAQVERGKSKSLQQLIEEWSERAPVLEATLSSPGGEGMWQAVADVATHLSDLANACGVPASLPEGFLPWIAPKLLGFFETSVAQAGLEPVSVTAPDFEIFRGRFGRRTREEVRAYDWSRDPSDCLDSFFIFGVAASSLNEKGVA